MITDVNVSCFLSLAETLNFTETAKALYMSQQAVSKNIARLEESLSLKLLNRDSHAVELTESGQALYALFKRQQGEFQEKVAALKDAESRLHMLRLGFQNWIELGQSVNRTTDMLQSGSNAYFVAERHTPYILQDKLAEKRLDAIIVYKSFLLEREGVSTVPLLKLPRLLMISPDHIHVEEKAAYENFLEEPYIFDYFENEKFSDYRARAQRMINLYGLRPRDVIIMPNRDSAFTAAEDGRGIVITTPLSKVVKSFRLKGFVMENQQEEFVLAFLKNSSKHELIMRFADELKAQYMSEFPEYTKF